jgi:hypothetical protein
MGILVGIIFLVMAVVMVGWAFWMWTLISTVRSWWT